jgi:hypothetical protein
MNAVSIEDIEDIEDIEHIEHIEQIIEFTIAIIKNHKES